MSNDSMHLWTYWYDPLGRRTLAADSIPTLGQPVKRFFYDGDDVVLVGDAYFQAQGGIDGHVLRLHNPQTNAVLNELGLDRPLASVGYTGYDGGCGGSPSGGRTFFYHADERGSIRNVSWASDSVCSGAGYTYQGFGQNGGAIPTNSRPGYTGAPSDASGLVFMRNRFYDPNTGSFTQADPIGLLGGINLYGYVGNNPVAYTDPFGLTECPDKFKNFSGPQARCALAGLAHAAPAIQEGAAKVIPNSILSAVIGMGVGKVVGAVASRLASAADATAVRYVGAAEAKVVAQTGVIPATNAAGEARVIHFTTDAAMTSASAARATYGLGATPTHMVTFPLSNVGNFVRPLGAVAADATQAATSLPIKVPSLPIPLAP